MLPSPPGRSAVIVTRLQTQRCGFSRRRLLGTLAQETFATHPALGSACGEGIENHARTLAPTIEAARDKYARGADWTAESLALYTQVVLQGSFVLAKAKNDPQIVLDAIAHLRRHIELLFPIPPKEIET